MNIAEILKYCPKGTKLYSLVDGEVTLENICNTGQYSIEVITSVQTSNYFTKDGLLFPNRPNGECVLFPSKDQRDWGKFRLPFKAGDIVMTIDKLTPFIFKEYVDDTYAHCYCGVDVYDTLRIEAPVDTYWTSSFIIPASEEAKKELFDKMAEAGYKWNADTLELEKIESKFKEGDVVIDDQGNLCLVSKIRDDGFITITAALYTNKTLNVYISNTVTRSIQLVSIASITDRNKLYSALVREGYKYDKEQHLLIKQEFKPFDKVLIRDEDNQTWRVCLFSHYRKDLSCPYVCVGCSAYKQCIPYEGNEYLLATTDSPE